MNRISRTLLPLCLLLSSLATQAADPPPNATSERLLADKEQERMMALAANQPPATTPLWLETQHESYLGLFQPANQPQPRGGILLLPHDRTSPDWPGAMQTLRRGLPDKGWHTLALALPDEPLPILALIPASTASASEEDPLKDHFVRISQRLDVAIKALQERGANRIYLVGEGSGGYWAMRYIADHLGQQLYPILIDAAQPNTPATPPLYRLTETLQLPVLDLYHGNGLGLEPVEQQARLRNDSAKRGGLSQYLSVRMPPRAGDWRQTEPRLLALVSGLIERHMEKALQPEPTPVEAPRKRNRKPGQ